MYTKIDLFGNTSKIRIKIKRISFLYKVFTFKCFILENDNLINHKILESHLFYDDTGTRIYSNLDHLQLFCEFVKLIWPYLCNLKNIVSYATSYTITATTIA